MDEKAFLSEVEKIKCERATTIQRKKNELITLSLPYDKLLQLAAELQVRENELNKTIQDISVNCEANLNLALEENNRHAIQIVKSKKTAIDFAEQAYYAGKKSQKSSFGKDAANSRHNQPGGSRELKDKICKKWQEGNFSSRDKCADEEWEAIGFNSRKAARNALMGTSDPSPWPARKPRC